MFSPRNSRYAAKLFHTSVATWLGDETRWVWICLEDQFLMKCASCANAHAESTTYLPCSSHSSTWRMKLNVRVARKWRILNIYKCMVKIYIYIYVYAYTDPWAMTTCRSSGNIIWSWSSNHQLFFSHQMFSFQSKDFVNRRHLQGKAFVECSDKIRLIHFVVEQKHRPLHRHVLRLLNVPTPGGFTKDTRTPRGWVFTH